MEQQKRIKTYQVLGIIIAISSLILSLGSLTTTYAYTGIATISKDVYNVELKNVTDIYEDGETISILKNPIIIQNEIQYGLSIGKVNEYTKFQFNIENVGNVDASIKEIIIDGYEDYKDYITVEIHGLPEDKIIKGNSIAKIDVITTYKNPLLDETEEVLPIALNELSINIILEKV